MTSQKQPLRLLLVDDSEDDAQLLVAHLEAAGLQLAWRQVDTPNSLRAALGEQGWDAVLSDHNMQGFDALSAFDVTRRMRPDMPFIIVSGQIGEQLAVQAMNAGVSDYVFKDNLARLAPSLKRALGKARLQEERALALRRLREREAQLGAITRHIPGAVFRLRFERPDQFEFPYLSEGVGALLSLSADILQKQPWRFVELLSPEDRQSLIESILDAPQPGRTINWSGRIHLCPGEETKWINVRATVDSVEAEAVVLDGVMLNVTASKEGELALTRSQAQLQALTARLQEVREDERQRISREIHDELGSAITALKMDFYVLRRQLPADDQPLQQRLRTLSQALDEALEGVRRIAQELRPRILDDLGPVAAIKWHLEEFERRSGIRCHLQTNLWQAQPDAPIGTVLYRIVQEALTNVMRHARASEVNLKLFCDGRQIKGEFCDNGIGIPAERLCAPDSTGLYGMQERASSVDGHMEIASSSAGTCIRVTIPCQTAKEAAGA